MEPRMMCHLCWWCLAPHTKLPHCVCSKEDKRDAAGQKDLKIIKLGEQLEPCCRSPGFSPLFQGTKVMG